MAARFWVGGTGTWDASTTTHWSTTTGGAGGASVPGSADTITFDASSGGGTVTGGAAYNPTAQSITCGAFTGTLDFSVNNNNVTLTAAAGMNASGTGTRTISLGNGTWTMTGTSGTPWNFATTTGLTFNANSSSVIISGVATGALTFAGGSLTYNSVTFSSKGVIVSGTNTFASLLDANTVYWPFGATTTITNAFTLSKSSSSPAMFLSSLTTSVATISIASGTATIDWGAFRQMTFTGGATFSATNSLDGGQNTGISISAPSGGGSGGNIASRTQLGM